MHRLLPTVLIPAVMTTLLASCATLASQGFAGRDDVRAFAREISERNGLDEGEVRAALAQARPQPSIIEAMTRPAEAKPWHQYRPIFLTEKRIADGVDFWREHADRLTQLERQYGVPAEILVAIVGVETGYGRNVGRYAVRDALATLAFDYPPRAPFFRKELEQFFLLARDEKVPLAEVKGSYAGAMGMPQFMPSSYRNFAVDGDGDGRRDLWSSADDVLASVANYFARHGWQPGGEVAWPVELAEPARLEGLMNRGRDLKAKTSLGELRKAGVSLPPGDDALPAMLIPFREEAGETFWVGLPNFYVITRYNHSAHYAMAVWQLGQAVRDRFAGSGSGTATDGPHPRVSGTLGNKGAGAS
ncbi:MAG: lytic murein transglycosylase B [Halothiobacillaceae bacterium]